MEKLRLYLLMWQQLGGGVILRWHVCVRHKHWNKQLLLFGDFFASVKPWLMGSIKKKRSPEAKFEWAEGPSMLSIPIAERINIIQMNYQMQWGKKRESFSQSIYQFENKNLNLCQICVCLQERDGGRRAASRHWPFEISALSLHWIPIKFQ